MARDSDRKTVYEWSALNDRLRSSTLKEAREELEREITGPKRKAHVTRIYNRVSKLERREGLAALMRIVNGGTQKKTTSKKGSI